MILGIIVLGLLLSTASFSSTKKGKGEVTIKESTVDYFIQYIRGKSSQKPLAFILSSNGYWLLFTIVHMLDVKRVILIKLLKNVKRKQMLNVDYLLEDIQLCGKMRLIQAKEKYQLLKVNGVTMRLEQS